MAETPEGKVKKKIKSWFRKHIPLAWWFMPVSRGFGVHGVPDFVMCVPKVITADMVGKTIGMFVGIEAKAKGKTKSRDGTPTANQLARISDIRDAGGIAFVLKGKPEEIHAMLDAVKHLIS